MPDEPADRRSEEQAPLPEPTHEEVIQAELEEMERKLADFEGRMHGIREGSKMPEPPELKFERPAMLRPDDAKVKSDRDAYRGLGVGLSVAYTLLGLPVAGYGIGWLIDQQVGGTGWSAGLSVVGFAAGLWFTVYTVNRIGSK